MNKLTQKTFIIILIFYLAAFIFFFIFSIFSFESVNIIGRPLENPKEHGFTLDISIESENPDSELQILSKFKLNWILSNSLKLFIQYLLPIQSTALIIAFSLIFPWKLGYQGMQIPFVELIGKNIFLFLILTLIFSGLTEILLPGTLKRQSDQIYLTQMATGYFKQAQNELDSEEKDYKKIITMLKAYLQIDPGHPVVKNTLDWAESTYNIKTDFSEDEDTNEKNTSGIEAADLVLKASNYFSEEDYYSALYYANLAFQLDESRSDAQRISAESREAIRSLAPDKSEIEAKEYFEEKRAGFELLNEGNSIDAYYIFKKLSVDSNTDKDISEFLARSLEAISDNSFFINEAESYKSVPGINDIVFLNNKNTLIYIEKMINLNGSKAYFFNIELIELDNSNKIIKHFSAPYGKFNSESNSIIMNAIDPNDKSISYKPLYHIGTDREPENLILKLSPNVPDLKYIGQPGNTIKFMNIFELFKYGSIFSKFGYIQEPIQILILERIVKPFTFLIISFLSVSLGWYLRIRKYNFPVLSLLFIPVIGYLINNILLIYEFGINLILGFSILKTGFYTALIILLVSQAILLFFSLITVASQKN